MIALLLFFSESPVEGKERRRPFNNRRGGRGGRGGGGGRRGGGSNPQRSRGGWRGRGRGRGGKRGNVPNGGVEQETLSKEEKVPAEETDTTEQQVNDDWPAAPEEAEEEATTS